MSRDLDADLARWERGDLSLAELCARHPSQYVAPLAGLHTRLAALTSEPTPDAERAWAALAASLPNRPSTPERCRLLRVRRPVVAAIVAAVIAVPALSYAAAPDAVRAVVREATRLLPGGDTDGTESPEDQDGAPSSTSVPSPNRDHRSDVDDRETTGEVDGNDTDTDTDGGDSDSDRGEDPRDEREGVDEDDDPEVGAEPRDRSGPDEGGSKSDSSGERETSEEFSGSGGIEGDHPEVSAIDTEAKAEDPA